MKRTMILGQITCFALAGILILVSCGGGGGGSDLDPIVLVSVSSAGGVSSDECETPAVNGDGRYVAFVTNADNLVTGDTNDDYDVFLRDIETGITTRVSVSTAGTEGTASAMGKASYYPAICRSGRYVAFEGEPGNFVTDDTNDIEDIFLRDTQLPMTSRVSVSTSGTEGERSSHQASVSNGGIYVAFESESDDLVPGGTFDTSDIFLRDTQTNMTSQVSVSTSGTPGNGDSLAPDITPDGRYIVFESFADNLVAGSNNSFKDIYLKDVTGGLTSKVSVSSAGTEGTSNSNDPAVSEDGRYVVFVSGSDNLVPGDTNKESDIFLRDTQMNITSRVSVSTAGTESNNWSGEADISNDGRYIVFTSHATNLVAGDTNVRGDIFVRDTLNNTTRRVSVNADGVQSDGDCHNPVISGDGNYVAFESDASNLVTDPVPAFETQIYLAPRP